jgi:hypothetical protein
MKPRTLEEWFGLVEKIQKAGMLDLDPKLYMACKLLWETYDTKLIEEVIDEHPWIMAQAMRDAYEIDQAEKDCPLRPYPEGDELELISGKYKLGHVNYNLDPLGMNDVDFTRGLFITGGTGSGKTYPVMRLLDEILSTPREERDFNVLIIQGSKNDFDPFAMTTDMRVLNWKDLRYNMWEVQDWDTAEDNMKAKCNIFANENFLLAHTIPALRSSVRSCYENGLVTDRSHSFPTFGDIKTKTSEYFINHSLDSYTFKDANQRLHNRLIDHIDEGPILNGRCGFTTDFFMTWDLCINVIDENEYPVRTTIFSILYDIQRYLTKFPDRRSPSGMRTLVIIDEARWLFNKEREQGQYISDKILIRWFTTSRETGFGRIIITQEPESVSDYIAANSAFSLTFPVHGRSFETVKRLQNLSDEQADYLFKLPKYGDGIFRYPGFPRPILIQIPGDLTLERSTPLSRIEDHCKPFIERVHEEYASASTGAATPITKPPVDRKERRREALLMDLGNDILDIVHADPFQSYTDVRDTLAQKRNNVSSYFAAAVEKLKDEEVILIKKCTSWSGKPGTQFIVSSTGVKNAYASPQYFKHCLYMFYVKMAAIRDGYSPELEYSNHNLSERIDVYVENDFGKIAFEIELSNKNRDILNNIQKCIYGFHVDRLIIITESGNRNRQKIMRIIESGINPNVRHKIRILTIQRFLQGDRVGIWS